MGVSRKLPLGEGETARTACAPGLLRAGAEEKTGEVLTAGVLAQRVGWAADLVCGIADELLAAHWNAADVDLLASGADAGGRARCAVGEVAGRPDRWGSQDVACRSCEAHSG
ncbi:hypothetical protein ABZZ16_00100 [Streptomyces sp. NPDC006386]|uniref:hypothetical protein n=1 Tax=unclassified Streptomyces TaxID=2593676 RepID=UPI0033BDD818